MKYYTCRVYRDVEGRLELKGSRMVRVWFWQSPMTAYEKLAGGGRIPMDLRRVK